MAIDLKDVEERLAKAKEEAEFWEKARTILADPRLNSITAPQPRPITPIAAPEAPRAYGEMKNSVYAVLPEADAGIAERMTTLEIVARLQEKGYAFKAKEPQIAVNGALTALEEKGFVEWSGKRGNAKLWRRKRQKSQEATEVAS
jgi:hypothetical protein